MPKNSSSSPSQTQPRTDRLDALRALLDKAAKLKSPRLRRQHVEDLEGQLVDVYCDLCKEVEAMHGEIWEIRQACGPGEAVE